MLGAILTAGTAAFLVLALWRVARFCDRPLVAGEDLPPASIMVPAHGAPPRLYECLRSICEQDYPEVQVVFGLHGDTDAAKPVIERLMAEFPHRDLALVIDGRMIGANPKNCNLANMYPAVKHDMIVMVDSDVIVGPGFLATIVKPLLEKGVGGVTCIYKGAPEPNMASQLGALYINDWFIPSVLVDVARRDIDICFGAAIAVTRTALARIGGFEAMASAVAQDYVFGHELSRHGFIIRLAPYVVETVVDEPTLSSLYMHELRWNRNVRAVRPLDHALSIFMNGMPLAALLFLLPGESGWMGEAAVAGLVPVREVLNVIVWIWAFFGRTVRWGGRVMVTNQDLTMDAVSHE